MRDIKLRAWSLTEKRWYYRAYQRLLYVILCSEDPSDPEGLGIPVKNVPHEECDLMETASTLDFAGREIFEGDIVEVHYQTGNCLIVVESVADMYRSRGIHPMQEVLDKHGIKAETIIEFRIVGNKYENKELLAKCHSAQ